MTEAVSHGSSDEDESNEDDEFVRSNRDEIEDLVTDPWQSRKSGSWLGDQLFNARVSGGQPSDAFLPGYKLNEIITTEAVRKDLIESRVDLPEANLTRIVESVCHLHKSSSGSGKPRPVAFRKIFAILVLIGKAPSIIDFIRQNVSDNDLPLSIKLSDDEAQIFRSGDPTLSLSCFEGWNNGVVDLFNRFQWVMITPLLNNNRKAFRYELDPKHLVTEAKESVLPGFGNVSRVTVHKEGTWTLENSLVRL